MKLFDTKIGLRLT